MDFSLTEEQEAVRDLARQILAGNTDHERLKALEDSGEWFDEKLWKVVAEANLPGLAFPEAVGGSGFGFAEVALALVEVGRATAPIPLWQTMVLGGLPIAEFGTPEQHERWLRPAAGGDLVMTAALAELGSDDPAKPGVTATRDGAGFRLDGRKVAVSAGMRAGLMLVPARTDDGVGVFALDPGAAGVSLEREVASSGEPQATLTLSGASVAADAQLGNPGDGACIVQWLVQRAQLALCAMQLGAGEEAMRQTAVYVTERKQFGRPIGTFQGVALRAADAYIDLEAMRGTFLQAVWRVSEGLDAERQTAAARWWACRGGERVVHAAQHLHGGIGADLDYPIHRFFYWSKQNQATLGGASSQLARLGKLLVAQPAGAA